MSYLAALRAWNSRDAAGTIRRVAASGSASLGDGAKSHLRLCFALNSKENIREGVAKFARVCFEETGIPPRSRNTANAAG